MSSSTPDPSLANQTLNVGRIATAPPDPFTGDRNKFRTFSRQLALNFAAHLDLYGADAPHGEVNRILFTLSFMKGGLAEEWANQFVDTHLNINTPTLGSWTAFTAALEKSFTDPNATISAQHQLETMRQEGRPAEAFFMEFEQVFHTAGYLTPDHDTYLVSTLERNLHPALVDKVYGLEIFPTSYEEWRDKAINFDQLHRRREECKKALRNFYGGPTTRSQGPPPARTMTTPGPAPATALASSGGRVYGGSGAPMDLDQTRGTSQRCFNCNKEGHIARNCQQPHSPRTYARVGELEEIAKE
jgi:hypothetical protein